MARKKTTDDLPGGQEHFDGMEPMPKNPKIHLLAQRVKKASKAWSKAAGDHKDLKDNLTEAMLEAGLIRYTYGDVTVDMDTKRKVKVTIANDDDSDDE